VSTIWEAPKVEIAIQDLEFPRAELVRTSTSEGRHGLTTSSRLPAKSPLANTALIARLVWSCGGNSMSAFLNQKLGQKPGSTNTPVVGATIVKPVEPSVTLRALLSRLASELSVS
jgi:hypothetical protein